MDSRFLDRDAHAHNMDVLCEEAFIVAPGGRDVGGGDGALEGGRALQGSGGWRRRPGRAGPSPIHTFADLTECSTRVWAGDPGQEIVADGTSSTIRSGLDGMGAPEA